MKLLCDGVYAKFDDMLWHLPGHRMSEIAWMMIHGTPTNQDLMLFAGVLSCYHELITMPDDRRRPIIRRLRKALKLDAVNRDEGRK